MKFLLLKLKAAFHNGKSILVEFTKPGAAAGDPENTEQWNLTANIVATHDVLSNPPTTYSLFGTQVTEIKEGKGRIVYKLRKGLKVGTDYDRASAAANVSTDGYKIHKRDYDEVELNYYLETEGTVYDKRKDNFMNGIKDAVATDIGALLIDLSEKKADKYWATFLAGVKSYDGAAGILRTGFDGKTYKVPSLHGAAVVVDDATKASAELDKMYTAASNLARIGKANGGFQPNCRIVVGGKVGLNSRFVINEDMIPFLSHDKRWEAIGKGAQLLSDGVQAIGKIKGVPVITDDNMPMDTLNWALVSTGARGAVCVADEFPAAFGVKDHPTKFTKFMILDGDVAFDAFVTRYMDFTYCSIKKAL